MLRALAILSSLTFLAVPAAAQDMRGPSHCIAIADALPEARVVRAAFRDPLPRYTVRLTYLGHASFLIQEPGGLDVVTDYTGFLGTADFLPDIVTMNHAHETHWTAFPDPAIPHVLRGWGDTFGAGIEHHLDLGTMLVRNVSTDIRDRFGAGIEPRGNSIFIFETEGLCIGHLGHLHHEPTDAQYAAIGRLDVVMVPVDGGLTVDIVTMTRIVTRLKSSVVIPMHWFSGHSLNRFLDLMAGGFAIERRAANTLEVSLRSLPHRPTIVVLQPRGLVEPE